MDKKLQTFIGIMVFYALLSCVIVPAGFYYFMGKSLMSAGNGFIVGSVVSVGLWIGYGKTMI